VTPRKGRRIDVSPFPKNHESGFGFSDFPVGQRVSIVSNCVDMSFFKPGTRGKVIKNTGDYLGIRVKFDEPRVFTDGYVQSDFNFNPNDLEPLVTRLVSPVIYHEPDDTR
jgi:hypothetical protein